MKAIRFGFKRRLPVAVRRTKYKRATHEEWPVLLIEMIRQLRR